MTNKTALKRLKLDPYFSRTIETNLNVWSHDVNSFEIKFEFYDHQCNKPISLKNAVGRVLLLFSGEGNKKHVLNLDIESEVLGLAKIVIPKRILGYEGIVNAHIYIDFEGKTHDFGNFLFRMKRSAIDGDFPELDTVYVSEFEKALQDIKDKSNQFDGVEEELNKRIDVIEKDITSNEIAKKNVVSDIVRENIIENSLNEFVLSPRNTGQTTDNNNYQVFRYEIDGSSDYTFSCNVEVTDGVFDIVTVIFFDPAVTYDVPIIDGKITVTHKADGIKHTRFGVYAGKSGETRGNGMIIKKAKLEKNDQKTIYKPHITEMATKNDTKDLQKQIDELKNAITTLGGTL